MKKKIVTFYGTSGHGKGLVDAISSFGANALICRVVLTEDFSYRNNQEISDYLVKLFQPDSKKYNNVIEKNETEAEKIYGFYKFGKCRYPVT